MSEEPLIPDIEFEGQAVAGSFTKITRIVRMGRNKNGKILKISPKRKKKNGK